MTVELYHGDCLVEMDRIADHSVDAIIADWPYGTTACKWDTVIPFEPLWAQCKRVIKPKGAIVLFGSQPFTSALVMSNVKWFKYEWVWKKSRATDFMNCNNRPMRKHENILVFSEGTTANGSKRRMPYYPQGLFEHIRPKKRRSRGCWGERPQQTDDYIATTGGHPTTVLEFTSVSGAIHPTQKPVDLLEYLIRTYASEGETVLDNTMGSGTTGVACVNTGRSFIGIELLPVKVNDPDYFGIAVERIARVQNEMEQLTLEETQ